MIKIQHGTAQSGDHLCRTCTQCIVAKGHRLDEEIIWCSTLERDIEFPIHSCTLFKRQGTASLRQMQEDALYIDVNKKTAKIGFTKYEDLPDDQKWQSLE